MAALVAGLLLLSPHSAGALAVGEVPTSSPTSSVQGKVFSRFVTIWLENTDYAKAAGDRQFILRFLPSPSAFLSQADRLKQA